MNLIRKHLKTIASFMSVVVLIISCSHTGTIDKKNYSGENLFRSVFFAEGDFAKKIGMLKEMSELLESTEAKERLEFNTKVDALFVKIRQENPHFFENFKDKITSGNHFLIQDALNSGSLEIRKNLNIFDPNLEAYVAYIEQDIKSKNIKTEQDIENYLIESQPEMIHKKSMEKNLISENSSNEPIVSYSLVWAVGVAVYFVAAFHNSVAVTTLFYFGAIYKTRIGANSISQNSNLLKKEILVNQIANYEFSK